MLAIAMSMSVAACGNSSTEKSTSKETDSGDSNGAAENASAETSAESNDENSLENSAAFTDDLKPYWNGLTEFDLCRYFVDQGFMTSYHDDSKVFLKDDPEIGDFTFWLDGDQDSVIEIHTVKLFHENFSGDNNCCSDIKVSHYSVLVPGNIDKTVRTQSPEGDVHPEIALDMIGYLPKIVAIAKGECSFDDVAIFHDNNYWMRTPEIEDEVASNATPIKESNPEDMDSYWNDNYFDINSYLQDQGFKQVRYDCLDDPNKGYYQAILDPDDSDSPILTVYTLEWTKMISLHEGVCGTIDCNVSTNEIQGDINDIALLGQEGYKITPEIARAVIDALPGAVKAVKECGTHNASIYLENGEWVTTYSNSSEDVDSAITLNGPDCNSDTAESSDTESSVTVDDPDSY